MNPKHSIAIYKGTELYLIEPQHMFCVRKKEINLF